MNDPQPTTLHWLAEPDDDAPTLWLERAAHLVRHHAADPFQRGYWEGTYRVEQQRLTRAPGKLFDARPTGDVPAEVVPIWEEEFALRSEEVRLANEPKALAAAEAVTPSMREFDPEVFGRMPSPEDVKAEAHNERLRCAHRRRSISHLRTRILSPGSQHRRAPSASGTRRCGSRRSSSSSRTSSQDPGDGGDADPPGLKTPPAEGGAAERACLAIDCEESIAHKAPQARFCSNACRVRDKRAQEARDLLAVEQSVVWDLPVDPDDVDPTIREVFEEETAGRCVRDWKRKHVPFQMTVVA